MATLLTKSQFAGGCGVQKSAITKAEATLRVYVNEDGLVPVEHQLNRLYLETIRFKKIGQMMLTREVLPRWSCLVARPADRRKKTVPLCFFPPRPIHEHDVEFTEEGFTFEYDVPNGKVKRDGVTYQLVIVTHPTQQPKWLDEDDPPAEGQPVRRRSSKTARGDR